MISQDISALKRDCLGWRGNTMAIVITEDWCKIVEENEVKKDRIAIWDPILMEEVKLNKPINKDDLLERIKKKWKLKITS